MKCRESKKLYWPEGTRFFVGVVYVFVPAGIGEEDDIPHGQASALSRL